MTDFSYWQAEVSEACLAICMVCINALPRDEMWIDEEGDMWDVCLLCKDSGYVD